MSEGWVRLWRWTAWGGIGLSLYAGWLTVDDVRDRASSERDISAACDQLVSGAAVMDLHGGVVRAESSEYDRVDVRELRSDCTIYAGGDRLFTLVVLGSSASSPLNLLDTDSEPFYIMDTDDHDKPDLTAVADKRPEPHPLGDGTLGWYGNWYTTIRAECGTGSSAKAPKLLHVTARAEYDDVSSDDRRLIAQIARSATEKLADRIGCQPRLPALPDDELATVPSTLRPAQTVGGTCRWFARHIKQQGQGQLPDRALGVPTQDTALTEGCLLAVSPEQVRRVAGDLPFEERETARSALIHSPWWLRTVSYFGAEARSVGYDGLGSEDEIIKPGTAGHAEDIWWASSVCDGKPALHTLTTSYAYDNVLEARALSALFRAYVDDITEQRGCTDVTYPDAKDFRDL